MPERKQKYRFLRESDWKHKEPGVLRRQHPGFKLNKLNFDDTDFGTDFVWTIKATHRELDSVSGAVVGQLKFIVITGNKRGEVAVSLANAGFQDKIFIRGDLQPIFHQREADGTVIYKSGAFAVLCELQGRGCDWVASGIFGVSTGDDMVAAEDITIHNGESFIRGLIDQADLVFEGIGIILFKDVEVADAQHAMVGIKIDAVMLAAIPDRVLFWVVICAVGGDGRGGGGCVGLLEPTAGIAQRFDDDLSFSLQFGEERELVQESCFHRRPTKAVFLTCLGIAKAEAFAVEILPHVPIYPTRVTATTGFAIDRFQGDNSLDFFGTRFGAQTKIVLVYGVGTKHAKQRNGELRGFGLGGEENIGAARVVALTVVAAPESVAVCTVLLFTIAESICAILIRYVTGGMGIEEPGTEDFRIVAENFIELGIEFVQQLLTLLFGIAHGEAAVDMPVPGVSAPPGQTNLFHKGLDNFKPNTNFKLGRVQCLQYVGVNGIDQGIVLNQKSASELILGHQFNLLFNGKDQINRFPWLASADKVDNVDDLPLFHRANLLLSMVKS